MGIWTHSLKFNARTGGIHQLPQTTGDGIHSLLREVVWDVGDDVPNPVLQLFHCARFCPVHLLLCQSTFASSLTCWFTRAVGEHIPHQRHVLLRSGCGWTTTSPCVRNRTCGQKLRMTILDCLLTDCGISSLHRKPPSLHSNHWIPLLIACSNLSSLLNSQAASHLCCRCACCVSRPLPTPSTREL